MSIKISPFPNGSVLDGDQGGTGIDLTGSLAGYHFVTTGNPQSPLQLQTLPPVYPAPGVINYVAKNVNFNAAADTIVPIVLPAGFTTFAVEAMIVAGVSGTFGTAKVGLYTAAAQGGQALSAQAIPVVTVGANTIGNGASQALAAGVAGSVFTVGNLYVNVGTPQGAASVANVAISIRLLY